MSGAIPFATDAWIKRLGEACNNSQIYLDAARNWEGDVYLVVEAEGRLEKTIYMYIDLYHGECRRALAIEDPSTFTPEFWISGPVSAWKEVTAKKIDPLKAILTRKLALKGNIAKIMRYAKATQALVDCSTSFDTEFPL
ncbi:MAG: SCP2 sterol-binding domain-containing protein [Anaerolineae bacterium]|nr:SCP2 sterol-binding domain-containing protein [Anaerolineae bacterium]